MEEDILKYSPTVMFRGTPHVSVYIQEILEMHLLTGWKMADHA